MERITCPNGRFFAKCVDRGYYLCYTMHTHIIIKYWGIFREFTAPRTKNEINYSEE